MKNALFTVYRILIALVLIGKILNWILKFSDEVNKILDNTLFSLIGIAFIVMGYIWQNKLLKFIITICGVFLIVMNFFNSNVVLDIIGIVCILTPMLIARFSKEKNGNTKPA